MLRAVFMLAAILALQSLDGLGSLRLKYPKEIKACDTKLHYQCFETRHTPALKGGTRVPKHVQNVVLGR